MGMNVFNFSHPLTASEHRQLRHLIGNIVVYDIPNQIEMDKPIGPQLNELRDRVFFFGEPDYIIPPEQSIVAAFLAREFPEAPIVSVVWSGIPTTFEIIR